jgi:hypothetical protein
MHCLETKLQTGFVLFNFSRRLYISSLKQSGLVPIDKAQTSGCFIACEKIFSRYVTGAYVFEND